MMRLACLMALPFAVSACTLDPNPTYCDGTDQHKCSDSATPYCDVSQHKCVAQPDLGGNNDMAGADIALDMTMIGCTGSAQCPDSTPICDTGHCRACASGADDSECAKHTGTPRCDSSNGACVACLPGNAMQSGDCASATAPICGTNKTCRACQSHTECSSMVCNSDGSCAATTNVVYVDNANGTCTGAHTGTLTDRFCDIQTAVTTGGKPIIRVFPSTAAYGKLTIASGTLSIVGPPATSPVCAAAGSCVTVSGDLSNPAVTINGATTVLALDGIEVTGGGTGQDGISCTSGSLGPSVSARHAYVHGVSGVGLSATKCKVALDQVQLNNNTGGGLLLTSVQYGITNCFVFGNGPNGPGVTFSGACSEISTGYGFAHNTVAKNVTLTGVSGVACNAGTTNIANTIVWSNGTTDTGGSGTCNLTGSAVAPTPAPDFVNSTGPGFDFHLTGKTTNNLSCCVDKITTSPVDHDYDGLPRPQPAGGKYDVGAHEVKQP